MKSAGITGRYETSHSVREFVLAQQDPRSGPFALKSYKTPVVFNPEQHKVQGMAIKESKSVSKSKEPKAQFYIKPLRWSDENAMNRFQKF
jgi:hypothetical protein